MSHHPQILVLRRWTIRDLLDAIRFPRRKTTVLPAVWVEELMVKRFGTLLVCASCVTKYRDGLRRWGYAAHPDMKAQGNACDFCQGIPSHPVPLWFKEEHRYPTTADYAREAAAALAPWPRAFRGDQRPSRPRPRQGTDQPQGRDRLCILRSG